MRRRFLPRAFAPGCALYLPFYAYGGNTQKVWDQSGNGKHGTITGAVPTINGWLFDGVDDDVCVSSTQNFTLGAAWSFLIWVRVISPGHVAGADRILNASTPGGPNWQVCIGLSIVEPYGALGVFDIGSQAWNVFTDVIVGGSPKFNFIAVTGDGVQIKAYFEGVQVGLPVASNQGIIGADLYFGQDSVASSYISMVLGELAAFSRALSADEIKAFYEITRHRYGV